MTTAAAEHDLDSRPGFERLYRAYYGYTWAVLAHLGVPETLVDDAHQDVFVTAYRRRDTFDGNRPIKPWLVGIARRVAFRYRRSQHRTRRKRTALSAASALCESVDLERQLEAQQFLRTFIDQLDPRRREVFILGELEGYTGPEIAEHLGIKVDTAYTRLRSARAHLRRALDSIEERPSSRSQIDRGLMLLLPRLSTPSRLAWLTTLGTQTATTLALGGAGLSLVVALAGDPELGPHRDHDQAAKIADSAAKSTRREHAVAPTPTPLDDTPPIQRATSAPAPTVTVSTPAETPTSGARSLTATATPAPSSRSTASPPAATSSPRDRTANDLDREVELLTDARRALASGRPTQALTVLEAHAHEFPASTLTEGRTALRIACLCAAGRREQARGEAKVFLKRHPSSTLAQHGVTRCEAEDQPTDESSPPS